MKPHHPRLVLLFIFLLFGIPVVVATLMHSPWWQYQPSGLTNRGTLVQPPVHIDFNDARFGTPERPADPPNGQWVILYPVAVPCQGSCLADVESLRQIHRAAGRRQEQLAVVPLAAPGSSDQAAQLFEIYAAFLPGTDQGGLHDTLTGFAELDEDGRLIPGQAFLVDPTGNIMMRYAADFDPTDLNKDLKRLLKWSEQDG
jgi:hypothetical protein